MLNTFDLMAALTEACETKAKNEEVDTDSDIELTGNIDEVFSEFEYIVACENASFIEDMNTAYGFMVETTTNTSLSKEDKSALIEASGKSVKQRIVELINKIVGAIKALLTKIKNFFVELGKKIKAFFSKKDKDGKTVDQKVKEVGNQKVTALAVIKNDNQNNDDQNSEATIHMWNNDLINKRIGDLLANSVDFDEEDLIAVANTNFEDVPTFEDMCNELIKELGGKPTGDYDKDLFDVLSQGGKEPTTIELATILKGTGNLINMYTSFGNGYISHVNGMKSKINDNIDPSAARMIEAALNDTVRLVNKTVSITIKAIRMRANEYMSILAKAVKEA